MTKKSTYPIVLGIYLGHDLGACLLLGGKIATMIDEERLNRFKHGRPNIVAGLWGQFAGKFGYFPWASVSYCLEANNIGIDDVDLIAIGDNIWAKDAAKTIADIIPIKDKNKIVFIQEPENAVHHFHHALSGFFASPFDEAAILVIDADGNSNSEGYEAESAYYFSNRNGQHKNIFKNRYKNTGLPLSGLGWMYEQVTRLLGFCSPKIFLADAGKTMGLASYGKSNPELSEPWLKVDGFNIDYSGFHHWLKEHEYDKRLINPHGGLAITKGQPSQYAMDVAYKVQIELEHALLEIATAIKKVTGAKNLCFAGGVGLNSVANGILAQHKLFEKIFVQPAANDSGQSIGLAYHAHLLLTSTDSFYDISRHQIRSTGITISAKDNYPIIAPIIHAYGGKTYSDAEIKQLLDDTGLEATFFMNDEQVTADAAQQLAAQKFIAWFQGGSEYGPRSLGNRSILADPRGHDAKDILNARVKFREGFRPFAPSVLAEKAQDVFELSDDSPYMLMVNKVKRAWLNKVPAIVHIDHTARIQTVTSLANPIYYQLISAFEKITQTPLLLNTSYNLKGMPIVESPYDALHCFLLTDLDYLYMGHYRLGKPNLEKVVVSLLPGWQLNVIHSNQQKTLTFKHHEHGEHEFKVAAEVIHCCEEIDGRKNLALIYETSRKQINTKDIISLSALFIFLQNLVRLGIMQLQIGKVIFHQAKPDKPWWQSK